MAQPARLDGLLKQLTTTLRVHGQATTALDGDTDRGRGDRARPTHRTTSDRAATAAGERTFVGRAGLGRGLAEETTPTITARLAELALHPGPRHADVGTLAG